MLEIWSDVDDSECSSEESENDGSENDRSENDRSESDRSESDSSGESSLEEVTTQETWREVPGTRGTKKNKRNTQTHKKSSNNILANNYDKIHNWLCVRLS